MAVLFLLLLPLRQDPDELVRDLADNAIDARERAADRLRALGDAAVPALDRARRSDLPEVRERARRLLHDLRATSALVEDLRADDIPGNARRARVELVRRYGPEVRAALLEAVAGDDPQQALQAGYVLAEMGDAAAALRAAPDLLRRSIAALGRRDTAGFDWLAGRLILRLGDGLAPVDVDLAWSAALRDVPADALDGVVRDLNALCRSLKREVPQPLLRRGLVNLRDDNIPGNAEACGVTIRAVGKAAIPALRAEIRDGDAQSRRLAAALLIDLDAPDLPADILVLAVEERSRAVDRLCALGEDAVEALRGALASPRPRTSIPAARGLVRLDPARFGDDVMPVLAANLAADETCGNALDAAQAVLQLGEPAIPALRRLLAGTDPQAAAYAAALLASLGRRDLLGAADIDRLVRLGRGDFGRDEPHAALRLAGESGLLRDSSTK